MPTPTTAYYLSTTNASTLYDMGCSLGKRDRDHSGAPDSLVLLDFGQPIVKGGQFGASLFIGAFATTTLIAQAAESFGQGYYVCTGTNRKSRITVAVGTNSSGSSVLYSHGQAWALMVNAIADWFTTKGYSGQVMAAGAIDIEAGSGVWASSVSAKDWVKGYAGAFRFQLINGQPPENS